MTPPASRWKRPLVVCGLVLLGLLALVTLALPRILASQLSEAAASALGRQVSLGGLSIGWLSGRVSVSDLEIGAALDAPPAPPERAPLRLARLVVDLSWPGLLERRIHLTRVDLDAPRLFLERRADGELMPLVLAQDAGDETQAAPSEQQDTAGWPLRLDALAVRDLELHVVRDGEAEQRELALRLAEVTLSDLALNDGALTLGAVAFQDPSVQVQRSIVRSGAQPAASPGAPADVAAHPPAGEAATGDARPGLLERYQLESLDVNGAHFTLLWEGGEPLDVSLDLSASGVSARPGERFPVDVELGLEGGSLALTGELGVEPLAFDGVLRWQELPLPRLLEASGAESGVALASGRSAGELSVALTSTEPGGAPAGLRLSGDARVSDLGASMPGLELAWSQLELDAERVEVPLGSDAPPVIALSRLTLREPRIVYEQAKAEATQEAPPPASDATSDAAPAPRVSLDQLVVEAGSVRFRDRTPREPFETRWQKVSLQGRGLRWPERDADSLKLTASGSGGAKLAVDASFENGRGRIETKLDRMALVPLDPYADTYTGIRIDEGRTSVRSLVEVGRDDVRTDSVVDLHRLRLHEQEAGWFKRIFGLPLDLALALLRDLDGDIRVPIRADFTEQATDVGFTSLLASTLRQAILGALTSPLKLLGSVKQTAGDVLGSGLAPIQAVPGEPAVRASERERLTSLAETLEDKPELQLLLHGRAGPADDAGIARRRLIRQARADEPLDGADALGLLERRRVREALAAQDPDAPSTLAPEIEASVAKLVAAARIDDAERRELAWQRADRVRGTLVGELGLPEESVAVGDAAVGDPGVALELRAKPEPGSASG